VDNAKEEGEGEVGGGGEGRRREVASNISFKQRETFVDARVPRS